MLLGKKNAVNCWKMKVFVHEFPMVIYPWQKNIKSRSIAKWEWFPMVKTMVNSASLVKSKDLVKVGGWSWLGITITKSKWMVKHGETTQAIFSPPTTCSFRISNMIQSPLLFGQAQSFERFCEWNTRSFLEFNYLINSDVKDKLTSVPWSKVMIHIW